MYNHRVAIPPGSAALLPQWLNERSLASTPCPSRPSASNGPLAALKMLARPKNMRGQPPARRPAAFGLHGSLVEGNPTFPAASRVYGPQPTLRQSALGAGEPPSTRWMPSFPQMLRQASTSFSTVPWARCKAIAAAVARMFRGLFIPKAASAWEGQATSPINAPAQGGVAPFPKDGRADGPNDPFQPFGVPRWKSDTAYLDEDEPFPSLQQPDPAKMLLCSPFRPPKPRSEEVDSLQARIPFDASKEQWKISILRPQQGGAVFARTPPAPPSSTLKYIPPVKKPSGQRSKSASPLQASLLDDVSKQQWKSRILPLQERSVPAHKPLTETRRNVYQPQLAPSIFSADQETD
ncbi:hypothetical protein SAMN04487768_2728 [Burkholderia sp. b13]|nr:hypothetical protein SAMN04487768_2728 [Burkholderia sp. b13]